MSRESRREFLADVGRGLFVTSLGAAAAGEMEFTSPAYADETSGRLQFGSIEPLVDLMQGTAPEKLMPKLVEKMNSGTSLKQLVGAAALANARRFGGEDYTGYHTFMALAPAYEMAQRLPKNMAPLPVMKVLYRNADRIQKTGGKTPEKLQRVTAGKIPKGKNGGELMQQATRSKNALRADQTFAAFANEPVGEMFNHVQFSVQDAVNVHRVVLPWRAWATLDIVGKEHAQTLLRQSVRFCVRREGNASRSALNRTLRTLLPKLLDQYRLIEKPIGKKKADDEWVNRMANLIYSSDRSRAADAVAAALGEGIDPEVVGEAISLAAGRLVLHDPGRNRGRSGKPAGSVHGDSRGVHATDAANAWRNIARVSSHRNKVASLVIGAYHTAGQTQAMRKVPYPREEHLQKINTNDPGKLLARMESAIRNKDQFGACAAMAKYAKAGKSAKPAFDVLLKFATSEDGALHAEKYYHSITEEFTAVRKKYAWEHMVALARVTASEYGYTAPGYRQARELLKLS